MASTLIEDLDSATATLCAALDSYGDTFAKLYEHYLEGCAPNELDRILDRVANEIQLVASYELKLKRTEAAMKVVRNSSPTVVPISVLPPEILTRIFHIALDDQPEIVDPRRAPSHVSISFPKQPERLSHVCLAWHELAVSTPDLWTRIDLALHHPLGPGFLARAKAHVERAGDLPLEVYMVDPVRERDNYFRTASDGFEDFDFLTFSNTPMSSLNVVSYRGLRDTHHHFISYCLRNTAQHILKQLIIRDASGSSGGSHRFIEPKYNQHEPKSMPINLSEDVLEGIWHSTSVLRLAGLYPYWTSRAYHQLVDLRLGPDRPDLPPISEAQIIDLLRASPRLRVFHLVLDITDPLPDTASIPTVQLHELESMKVSSDTLDDCELGFLRFIAPGQKPLQFSIIGKPTAAVEQFLRHSNVTQLRMVAWGPYPPYNALCLCPNLQVLVLDVWGSKGNVNFQTAPEQGDGVAVTPMHLKSLYVLRCQGLRLSDLQQIVEMHSVHELTLSSAYPLVEHGSQNASNSDVSSLCPVVNHLQGRRETRNPMDDWDLS